MRKKGFLFLFLLCFITIGYANGAGRSIINSAHNDTVSTSKTRTNSTVRKTNTTPRTSAVKTRTAKTQNIVQRPQQTKTTARSGIKNNIKRVVGRAAVTQSTPSQSFGPEYDTCQNAYFTCMDQFCATLDETYRRCICSSRLGEIKQKQSALSQTSDSLATFQNLNLDVINKSANEVYAMTHATEGEQIATSTKDKSDSAKQLNAISDVLSKTKSKSLSTAGTLDAGGDIQSIWSTTDLASGSNIANLTGESLYNAVNAQCSQMVESQCPSSVLNMVISAYGMYIENDCSAIAGELSKKKNTANAAIRETGREMGTARLANYDSHNSLSINDCIHNVRNDLTANTACGADFVHCLDVTGLYLNIDTGEPIYSANFYNLANQISLTGNILSNQTNHMVVNALNNKKSFAKNSLDKCRDLSMDVWDEFMRQAIIEIHQKQQEKIRKVKTECLSVVNQCYDERTKQLKDFSNVDDKTLLGLNLETVEDLCSEKLETCSNLYGGGANGLDALVNTMHDIVDQKILSECQNLLSEFGKNLCGVQSTDTLHSYPYACRVYSPGDQMYAEIPACNTASGNTSSCGDDYTNSLYQRLVNYAMQVCIRPSEYENLVQDGLTVPTMVLQDINIIMDKMRISMGQELSKECERLGGIWVATPYTNTSIALQEQFYTETGTNKKWGYCKTPVIASNERYTITFNSSTGDDDNTTGGYTASVIYGEMMPSITPPVYDNTNMEFIGYYDDSGNQYYDANGNATRAFDVTSNITLHAKYSPAYQVTFSNQNGSTKTIRVVYNTTIKKLADLIDTTQDEKFMGYYTAEHDDEQRIVYNTQYFDKNGNPTRSKWDITEDTTLYEKQLAECTISFYYYTNPNSPMMVKGTEVVVPFGHSLPTINSSPANPSEYTYNIAVFARDYYWNEVSLSKQPTNPIDPNTLPQFNGFWTKKASSFWSFTFQNDLQYYDNRGNLLNNLICNFDIATLDLYVDWIFTPEQGAESRN